MEVKKYLKNRIENCSKYELTKEDQKILDKEGIEEYIFRKLMSKKFKKWAVSEVSQQQVRDTIHRCVVDNKPLRFTQRFGGNKLYRLPSSPEPDWSEFFTITYYAQYMARIAAIHKPGVEFDFSSGDIVVNIANNLPKKDTDLYFNSFENILNTIRPYFVNNFDMKISSKAAMFNNVQEFMDEKDKLIEQARKEFKDDSQLEKDKLEDAEKNIQWKGEEDWSELKVEERNNKIRRAAEIIQIMYRIPRVKEYLLTPYSIAVFATLMNPPFPSVTIGSTKYSTAKFWFGIGVMAKNKDGFAEYVVTPKQWEQIKDQEHEIIKMDLILLKNFKQILVYPNKFDFTQ